MTTLRLATAVDAENPRTHDLFMRDGQLHWAGVDQYDTEEQAGATAQRIACRLLLVRGEWYQDQRLGTPWRDVLTAKGTSDRRIERIIREVIETTPGVAAVSRVTVERDPVTRTATVTWAARADTGSPLGPAVLDLPFILRET